ncbi:MAG: hypothetical protein JWR46_3126 [Mycobacterium sp.]|nr:hypothetical protein [Mycobacterium sp.]
MAFHYPPATDEPNPSADSPPRLGLIGRPVAVPRRQEPADPVRGDELAESARVVDHLVIPLTLPSEIQSPDNASWQELATRLPGDDNPHTEAAAPHLSTFIVQSSFESSLELILRGLDATPRD